MASQTVQTLTDEKLAILSEFRRNVSDLLRPSHNDEFLLRWLRARKFDLGKSEKMLREHMRFRRKIGWDKILTDYQLHEVIKKYGVYAHTGYDKEGCAVLFYKVGAMDIKGIIYSLDSVEHKKSLIYIMETIFHAMEEENKKTGRNARKLVTVVDFENTKMHHLMDKQVALRNLDFGYFFQDHFPEVLKCFYVINVPQFFYFWYNVAKRILDSEILKKVKIYGVNGWKDDLLEEVGADALPASYGGNITDPDGNPECHTMFAQSQKVPETYYLVNNDIPVTKDPDMKKIMVRERTFFNVKVQVNLPQHVIRWCFLTPRGDIRFGLFYEYVPEEDEHPPEPYSFAQFNKTFRNIVRRNSKGEHELLIPLEKIESHTLPEKGEFHCEKAGIYILHFDNTFSWITPKELYYKVEVVPASDVFISSDCT